MNRNPYWELALAFRQKILLQVKDILSKQNNELKLNFNSINILESNDNCIESSTAIGFLIEEFVVSQLKNAAKDNSDEEIKILRSTSATQGVSYDCYAIFKNEKFLINIKVEKNNNSAVAAIKNIHNDYVVDDKDISKHYLIIKLFYSIIFSEKGERIIHISDVEGYFLEEINFLLGYSQDHRNWTKEFNANSGRLQITKKMLLHNRLNPDEISHEKTKRFIDKIFEDNKNPKK